MIKFRYTFVARTAVLRRSFDPLSTNETIVSLVYLRSYELNSTIYVDIFKVISRINSSCENGQKNNGYFHCSRYNIEDDIKGSWNDHSHQINSCNNKKSKSYPGKHLVWMPRPLEAILPHSRKCRPKSFM